jgi:hypothetical protein
MICSLDEFRLLLKKWENESTQVAVFSIMRTPSEVLSTAVVQGEIKALTETSFTVADAGDSMARVNFDNCLFRFEDAENLFGVRDAMRYEECVVLGLKSDNANTFVSVVSIKQKTT